VGETKPDAQRGSFWRLVLIAALAAPVGAFVAANWHDRTFSLVITTVSVKAGIVIIASVAMGFAIGLAFPGSMSGPE